VSRPTPTHTHTPTHAFTGPRRFTGRRTLTGRRMAGVYLEGDSLACVCVCVHVRARACVSARVRADLEGDALAGRHAHDALGPLRQRLRHLRLCTNASTSAAPGGISAPHWRICTAYMRGTGWRQRPLPSPTHHGCALAQTAPARLLADDRASLTSTSAPTSSPTSSLTSAPKSLLTSACRCLPDIRPQTRATSASEPIRPGEGTRPSPRPAARDKCRH
jgi:hypothetical protein